MILESRVRDCLFLNWAVPVSALPEPLFPLRYQTRTWQGEDYTFVSALLFQQAGLHLSNLPLLRLSHPQCNLRLAVLDGDGMPSVLFRKMLLPRWMAPGVRLVTRQPAASAQLDFPRPSRQPGEGEWHWRVISRRRGALEVTARLASPGTISGSGGSGGGLTGVGPCLGSWEETVEYFLERPRGYGEEDGTLRCIEASHPARQEVAVWPLSAEVTAADLLPALVPLSGENGWSTGWPPLHSCWLCPEIPFVFEMLAEPRAVAPAAVPQAAASRDAVGARAGQVVPLLRASQAEEPSAHEAEPACAAR